MQFVIIRSLSPFCYIKPRSRFKQIALTKRKQSSMSIDVKFMFSSINIRSIYRVDLYYIYRAPRFYRGNHLKFDGMGHSVILEQVLWVTG